MFVFPEDSPVISGVRSIYVRMPIFIKYYLEQTETGCIYLHNGKAAGVLFFNDAALISGSFAGPDTRLEGEPAIEYISQAAAPYDFTLAVFAIAPEQIALWAGLQTATAIHSNLSTEFTDLKKLIAKMTGQSLTGYIDISVKAGKENGRIFLANGKFMGGNYSWVNSRLSSNRKHIEELIAKAQDSEGFFSVYSLPMVEKERKPLETAAEIIEEAIPEPEDLGALEELLALCASIIAGEKRIKSDFHTLLNKKFMQHLQKYPFFDPFAGEFQYHSGKITFTGDADEKVLAGGLIFTLTTLLEELQLGSTLQEKLPPWRDKHKAALERWNIKI